MSEVLLALCERAGLATSYQDYWHKTQPLDDAALRALLAAMGLPAADDTQAEATRQRLADEAARQVLPAMHVVQQSAPSPLRLQHPGSVGMGWQLLAEDGQHFRGVVLAGATPGHGLIALPPELPLGYHRLRVRGLPAGETTVAVCPPRGFAPAGLAQGERWWGVTLQLYALRSAGNWGIGDFSDLMHAVSLAAAQGAAFVGLNPLHALAPGQPERASPYSPTSRRWLNPLYLDVQAVPDFAHCSAARELVRGADFQLRLQQLRDAPLVDYRGVAAAKREVLALLYQRFRSQELARATARALSFRAFQRGSGAALRQLAVHQVWTAQADAPPMPPPGSPELALFAAEQIEAVEQAEYLQWLADQQLGAAAARARALGMPLGLYRDLAVGAPADSAEVWSAGDLHSTAASIGAPPEDQYPGGQSWGLAPPLPAQLQQQGYASFIALLRANMRHAGALRLDHGMALQRLFWVLPDTTGEVPVGSYVDYPLDDQLSLLALESVRQRCLVIAEDLGNVPDGLRERLQAGGVLSYRPMYFDFDDATGLPPPNKGMPQALAVVGTHDLPTLRAWWRGEDLKAQAELGLSPTAALMAAAHQRRALQRRQLLTALADAGLLPPRLSPNDLADDDPCLLEAVYAWLARSRTQLVGVAWEDVTQQLQAVNVPGSTEDQRPNWRVKLPLTLEQLAHDPHWQAVARLLRLARPLQPTSAAPALVQDLALPPLDSAEIPRATYRIQFHAGMRFTEVARRVPYLKALGVSHLYASPYLKARAGSTHGYDVIAHGELNPEIGSPQEFDQLCTALRNHGLQQLLDIVPNHMGVLTGVPGSENAWWQDVLECGGASPHAQFFDIDWQPQAAELTGKLLLPVLGDHYGRVLEAGELQLQFDAAHGRFELAYFDHRFPLDPRTYPQVLGHAAPPADAMPAAAASMLSGLLDDLARLPPRDVREPARIAIRRREKLLYQQQLAGATARHPGLSNWISQQLQRLNGKPGEPASFDALDLLIQQQPWRLAFWRVAGDEINYRRFFDISTLAALRMEREDVFEATHALVLRWLGEGRLSGLRVDHPDGLSDPRGYFERLQRRYQQLRQQQGLPPRALYLSVEKILAEHEHLPEDWRVHGGTGYRFAVQVHQLSVDSGNEAAFTQLYDEFTGQTQDFERTLREAKRLVMTRSLASDLQWLTEALHRIAKSDRRNCDFTRNGLRQALMAVAAGFPVYRTYIGPNPPSDADRQHLDWACADARRHSPTAEQNTIDFLRQVLLDAATLPDPARRTQALAFAARFQQFTSPVMAKAMEDTAFYRYHRLVSLNDVGGDPRHFGSSVAAFHAANQARARHHPHTLLGTSTHDTKRSEDVRARLAVLSEMPARWGAAAERWAALNRPRAERAEATISRNDEYLLYQTLVGIWPLEAALDDIGLAELRQRVQAYMQKAVREAKQHSSWLQPDEAYEARLSRFVDLLLGTLEPNPFLSDFQAWLAPVQAFGCWNSLSQLLLKLTSPGVPDIYQGQERWDFSLVDPDNRRPVDFDALQALLTQVREAFIEGQLPPTAAAAMRATLPDGRLKMLLTQRLLALRDARPLLFERGHYLPLDVTGPAAAHVTAFARQLDGDTLVVLAPRLLCGLAGADPTRLTRELWQSSHIVLPNSHKPPAAWQDALTGRLLPDATLTAPSPQDGSAVIQLPEAFADWPMAVLMPTSL
ncbi:malto-oligosyltrehalose synthase [Ideonella azotifigens]|uniref:4-alpha-glucanotransferase n=1 Tax=Ideonella azotifigens TaxID=513160 RepID=A0ABN1KK83_9BURK|nr:malto-oligosyltrehalose synthase [Ideonella azotifigens]MCD2339275.1 malto-oligosyltrehalose synthase [Ideonella azotifigens]